LPLDKAGQGGKPPKHQADQLYKAALDQGQQLLPGGFVTKMNPVNQPVNPLGGGYYFHHDVVSSLVLPPKIVAYIKKIQAAIEYWNCLRGIC
jgi:hypothetical protein